MTIVLATVPLALCGCGNSKSSSQDSGMGAAAANPSGGGVGSGGAGGVLGTDTLDGSGGWTSGGGDAVGGGGGTTSSRSTGNDASGTGGTTSIGSSGADAGKTGPSDANPATDAAADRTASAGRCQALRVAPERKNVQLRVVDLDGDGHLDVVSADGDGLVTIHRGTGGRAFEAPRSIPIASTILSFIAVGHLNDDGFLDLAVIGDTAPFILLATAPGTFQSVLQAPGVGTGAPLPQSPRGIEIVDLDGDGKADLAVADAYQRLNVYWGNGTGTFAPAAILSLRDNLMAAVFGDFNEDGRADAVVTYAKAGSALIPMGSNRTLDAPVTILGFQSSAAAVGDINGDGHLDLAIPAAYKAEVVVRLGDGKGGLSVPTSNPPTLKSRLDSIAIADFDGDRLPDLAVGNGTDHDIAFLLGDGKGSFGSPTHVKTAWLPIYLDTGDLDRDGFTDLVVSENGQGLTVLFGPCP